MRLPKGRWNLYADISGQNSLTVTHTAIQVDNGDQQITLDARQGRPARLDPTREFYAVPTREAGLRYQLRSVWDSTTGALYDLVDHRTGEIPADMGQRARRAELAKVEATFLAAGVAAQGRPYFTPRFDDELGGAFSATLPQDVTLPGTATYYRTAGLTWDSAWSTGTSQVSDAGKVIKRGRTTEVWNAAVTGPSFAQPNGTRTGDELSFHADRLFADGVEGRTGADDAATGTATLARDGRTIAETALAGCLLNPCELTAALPAQRAEYTLTTSMRRHVPHTVLSSSVESTWTFTSGRTTEAKALPLMAVRYAPTALDSFNRARPGTVTRVPVRVERNPGAPQAKVTSLKLEMSSDEGASWRPLPSVPTVSGWTAAVPNPGTPGFVSFRATATDTSGTTVIRAYAVS